MTINVLKIETILMISFYDTQSAFYLAVKY